MTVHLAECASTQDEVRARLADAAPGAVVAVSADHQHAGRGREQRTWHTPRGAALLLSVGRRGPIDVAVLEELPRLLVQELQAAVVTQAVVLATRLAWKAPNDLVAAADGAKVAGVLVDARTRAMQLEEVIVGVGMNVAGAAFTTPDGRTATTLDALAGSPIDAAALRRDVQQRITRLLTRCDASR